MTIVVGSKKAAPSLDHVRAAKKTLQQRLRQVPTVNGVGITKVDGSYALKVNLTDGTRQAQVPSEINGVAVHSEVVGPLRPRGLPTAARAPRRATR